MLQYTTLILDKETGQPVNSVVIFDQKLSNNQWRKLIKAFSDTYNVSIELIKFSHDYYTELKAHYEAQLQSYEAQELLLKIHGISIDLDADDHGSEGLPELIYNCEQQLVYELPNPLN